MGLCQRVCAVPAHCWCYAQQPSWVFPHRMHNRNAHRLLRQWGRALPARCLAWGVCAQHQYSAVAQHVPFVWRLHRQGVCSVPVHCGGRLQQQCWYSAGCMSLMHFVWRVERWQCHSTGVVVAPSWVHVTSAIRVDEAQTLRQCVYVRHHCSAGTNSSITSWVLWLDMCASGCMECSLHGCGQHHCLPMD